MIGPVISTLRNAEGRKISNLKPTQATGKDHVSRKKKVLLKILLVKLKNKLGRKQMA